MVTTISGFPYKRQPINNVTPFTYRDGTTFLEELSDIKDGINNRLIPEVNGNLETTYKLVQDGLESFDNFVSGKVREWSDSFNEFMGNVEGNIAGLNDSAVGGLVGDENSHFNRALTAYIADRVAADPDILSFLSGRYTVKDHVAVNAKDYPNLQTAINDVPVDGALYLPQGEYAIAETVTCATDGIRIYGDGVLSAQTPEMLVMHLTGNDVDVQLNIEGNNKAANGLRVTGARAHIHHGNYRNFYTAVSGASAIWVTTANGVTIEGNTISNVDALGDNIAGNNVGASRAIVLTGGSTATAEHIIRGNTISNILGEEGDGIQIIFGGASPFANARAIISDNRISRVSRRAIKVQAADTQVINNKYRHFGDTPQNPAAIIDVIHSRDVTVSGNEVDARGFNGIQVAGDTVNKSPKVVISDNIVRADTRYGINCSNTIDAKISGNKVSDGAASMNVAASIGVTVDNNVLENTVETGNGITIGTDCQQITVSNNRLRGTSRVWFIQNGSPSAIITDNINAPSKGVLTGGCVRSLTSAAGSIHRGNITSGNGPSVYTETSNHSSQVFMENYGGSGSSGGRVMWCTDSPAIEQPNMTHARGDVAYNRVPATGKPVGWVCTESSTVANVAGTWSPMGNLP